MAALRNMTARQQAILETFSHHRPSEDQTERIERNRLAFKICALEVFDTTPEGADQTAALRQLHEAMMTANKAIACEPVTLPFGTPRAELGTLDDPNPGR